MNLKQRYQQYKQRKEAQSYFRSHNQYVLHGKDMPYLLSVSLIMALILGFVLFVINQYISFILIEFIVGYFIGITLKKVHTPCRQLGYFAIGVTLFTFFVSYCYSGFLVVVSHLPLVFRLQMILLYALSSMIHMDLIEMILILGACYLAYNYAQ